MNKYTVSLETEIGTKINIIFKDPKALTESSNHGYVQGEAVDRLAAYEALGKTPEELAAIINGNQQISKENPKESEFNFEEAMSNSHLLIYKTEDDVDIDYVGKTKDFLIMIGLAIDEFSDNNKFKALFYLDLVKDLLLSEEEGN